MTMWSYLDMHPWWSLVFLLIVAGTVLSAVEMIARHK